MNTAKRFGLVLTLALVLATGFGCAKKQVAATPESAGAPMAAEDDSARRAQLEALARAQQIITDAKVYFDFDKFDLKAESKEVLKQKADVLKKFPSIRVLVEGHCDERGTQEYNLALGERRARAAYEYLVMSGVNAGQLEMISYGEERPAVEGHNEAAWSKNRRGEFKIIK
ncbi:peptidoglycan-associated lipoprotein Pal [Nitratidesulfovibrio sp. SRB-5]|uniref:Peptidoglycan-associated lipoprotein n=1 Tax=Nitratidesulfovibrio vulgaris (strain DSM 19637 / Miyazaki F) TaxID=883 RepID=B8DIK2_NITV9|nr:peptidoglycan-associated lipoprotein Pal [Nitratidesulfovibrio sp. SRB-5]MBZ2170524.1 peptidoglycan-associated lipoprotein Pal [Nitratidesulfovibrio sp. SRB-5]RXF76805.1 peptidoglycan-associated lipoprotein Pal [Desulfovibrio sp. DS-1]